MDKTVTVIAGHEGWEFGKRPLQGRDTIAKPLS